MFFFKLGKIILDLNESTTQADIYAFGICALEVIVNNKFLLYFNF